MPALAACWASRSRASFSRRASSACLRAVTSWHTVTTPARRPSLSRKGADETWAQTGVRSRLSILYSIGGCGAQFDHHFPHALADDLVVFGAIQSVGTVPKPSPGEMSNISFAAGEMYVASPCGLANTTVTGSVSIKVR